MYASSFRQAMPATVIQNSACKVTHNCSLSKYLQDVLMFSKLSKILVKDAERARWDLANKGKLFFLGNRRKSRPMRLYYCSTSYLFYVPEHSFVYVSC
jgi:hypothetical protein